MDNPLKGEVAFEADGERYRIVFAAEAMAALEAKFDLPMQDVAGLLTLKIRVAELQTFLRAGLLEYHPDVTDDQVKRFLGVMGVGVAFRKVLGSWNEAFDATEEAPKPDRPRRRAAGAGTG